MRRALLLTLLASLLAVTPAGAAVTVTGGEVVEGGKIVFTLKSDAPVPSTAQFATVDGTAKAGSDYEAKSQNVSFTPPPLGTNEQKVEVQTTADTAPELDEGFTATATEPGGQPKPAAATIKDDDEPSLSIADATVSEKDAKVEVKIATQPVSRDVTVSYATADDTANSTDFTATSGTLTVKAGASSASLTVPIVDDAVDEIDERFLVKLSGEKAAKVADRDAVITIKNDDLRLVSIGDIGVVEGDGEPTVARFPVQLSAPTFRTVSIQFVTIDGPAKAPRDYLARFGSVVFLPGQTQQFIDVGIASDDVPEPSEFFGVLIGQPDGASVLRGAAVAALRDDDAGDRGGVDRESPRMSLTKPRLSGGRSVRTRVTCPTGEQRCRGRLVLYARIGTAERRIGSKTFSLPGNAAQTLSMTLPSAVLARARKAGRLPVRAYVLTSDAAENVDTTEKGATLRFKKAKAKKKKKSSSSSSSSR